MDMIDSNVSLNKKTAQMIDLDGYVRTHYMKIRNSLINGQWIHDNMRVKLVRRMKHCMKIMRQFSRFNSGTYKFTLKTTKAYGDPLRDFVPSWHLTSPDLMYHVSFESPQTTIQATSHISVDSRVIVQ